MVGERVVPESLDNPTLATSIEACIQCIGRNIGARFRASVTGRRHFPAPGEEEHERRYNSQTYSDGR